MEQFFLLNQGVNHNARLHPERIAVAFQGETLNYGQLMHKANQLANTLISLGVQRGDRVGIFMYKNLNSAVAIYGILAAGAVYVPLDPFAPENRIAYVIENCDIKVLVSHEKKQNAINSILPQTHVQTVIGVSSLTIDNIATINWDQVEDSSGSYPELNLTEQDLAYILYTSGSTGNPKGIVHTHRSGLSFASWAAETYSLNDTDRLSNHAPLHFDLSTFDFFAASLVGATTVIIPEALTKFPANLSKWIQDQKITVWYSVPFALIQMLQRGSLSTKDLSNLRWILFAGEIFPTKHLRELMLTLPDVRFSNLYGPTETNVCTYYHVPPLPENDDQPISIGKACMNVEDLVVDLEDKPVKDGEIGELLIRSPLVMRGYWGRPDLTEKGFFLRKNSEHFADIFYRTGDLVQKMDDGNYKFFGRKDRQIKTRGYRVELDEIETLLLAHDKVAEAAVFVYPDGDGSNLIAAAVISKEGNSLADEELYTLLKNNLPPYAIPQKIEIKDQLPRTSTGKIDRRTLQELFLVN